MLRLLSPWFVVALALPLLAAKCGERSGGEVAGGEIVSDSVLALDHELTSDNYTKWVRAQDALDSLDLDVTVHLDSREASETDIERVVDEIERQPRARAVIEGSGFSVRDYVLTTVALAQSWDAVNRPGVQFTGLRADNVEFIRRQATEDPRARTRPRARFLVDDSDDSDRRRGKHKGWGKGKGKGKRK